MTIEIPTTGRIGRFGKYVKQAVEPCSFLKIVDAPEDYKTLKAENKAAWWRSAVESLASEAGDAAAKKIMRSCGQKCCGQVAQTKKPFINDIYCHCSAEFHKQFFKPALGKNVTAEISQSIICGAPLCEFVMHIEDGLEGDCNEAREN